jgi:hypothetical protein
MLANLRDFIFCSENQKELGNLFFCEVRSVDLTGAVSPCLSISPGSLFVVTDQNLFDFQNMRILSGISQNVPIMQSSHRTATIEDGDERSALILVLQTR